MSNKSESNSEGLTAEGFDKIAYQREYMRRKRADKAFEELSKCPEGYDPATWSYACERAERARNYARKMPEHVRPSEVRFQDPEWQYRDQARYPLPRMVERGV